MPIRIPQIVSQQGLAAQPGPMLDPSGAASIATAPARALGQASETLSKAFADYQRVNQKITEQDMKLDVESKLTEVRGRLAEEDINLRQEGVEPDQIPDTYRQRGTQAIMDVAGQLHYPQSRRQFQVGAEKLLETEVTKQRYRALDLKDARAGVARELLLKEHVNTAVFAEKSSEREEAIGKINSLIGEAVATGMWKEGKAEATTLRVLNDISVGRAQRAFQNPEQRATIIDQMVNGELKYVDPDVQMNLAHKWQTQLQEQDNQNRREFAAWWTREQDAKMLELTQRAEAKDLTISELDQTSRQWQFKDTDYLRIRHVLAAKPDEPSSDPKTLERVIADSHSRYPRMTERNLLDLKTQGLLNTNDWRSALDKRNATVQHLENEGKSDTERAYAQGKQRIKTSLGIPDIMDRVDDPRMGVWSMALDEYDRLAAGARGKVPPEKVSDDVIVKYRMLLNDRVNDSLANAQSLLRYNSMTELEKVKGRISSVDYDNQRRLLLQRDQLAEEARKQQEKSDAQKNAPGFYDRLKGLIPGLGAQPPANLR